MVLLARQLMAGFMSFFFAFGFDPKMLGRKFVLLNFGENIFGESSLRLPKPSLGISISKILPSSPRGITAGPLVTVPMALSTWHKAQTYASRS